MALSCREGLVLFVMISLEICSCQSQESGGSVGKPLQEFTVIGCGGDSRTPFSTSQIGEEHFHDLEWVTLTSESVIHFSCPSLSIGEGTNTVPFKVKINLQNLPMCNDASASENSGFLNYTVTFQASGSKEGHKNGELVSAYADNMHSGYLLKFERVCNKNLENKLDKVSGGSFRLECSQNGTLMLQNGFGFLHCGGANSSKNLKSAFDWRSAVRSIREKGKARSLILSLVGAITGSMLLCLVGCVCSRLKRSKKKPAYRGRRRSSTSTTRTREVEI